MSSREPQLPVPPGATSLKVADRNRSVTVVRLTMSIHVSATRAISRRVQPVAALASVTAQPATQLNVGL